MRRLLFRIAPLLLLLSVPGVARAQLDGVLQVNADLHHFLERQQTRGFLPRAHLSHRPLSAYEAQAYLDRLAERDSVLSGIDRVRLSWYRGTVPGPGARAAQRFASFLYPDGQSLFAAIEDDYAVRVEPLLQASLGPARRTERDGRDPSHFSWQYGRGARVAGHVGRYVYFEARLTENRVRPVRWTVEDRTVERLGFVSSDGDVYDYFAATGLVGFRSKYFEARFGRDRNHWGVGRGSLVLSNYASPYDFLHLRTTLGRFQYANLFAGLTEKDLAQGQTGLPLPRKYAAFHRLAVALPGNVQLGVFETVIFATDTLGVRRGFDLSYLNPVLFYRAVERDRGSPDNVLLGGDASWVPIGGLRVYGQLILDEMKVHEIGNGWWGNKWGWMLGFDVVPPPVPDLSVRVEVARLRPFLYGHRTPAATYVHYGDLLGHPAGPNAWDMLLEASFRATPRLDAALTLARTVRGRDSADQIVGSDPRVSYNDRTAERGIHLLDGVRQTEWLLEARTGYELLPRLHVELALTAHALSDAEFGMDRYVLPMLQVRWASEAVGVRW